MSYQKQITIEASSNNRSSGENNIFSVNIPNLNIPRGAKINVSGSIIEELGAANSSIIELQNTNISKNENYISSFQGITINYYINNNGYQSVGMPLVYVNGYKVSAGDTVYNLDVGSIKHNGHLSLIKSYLGTPAQALNADYTGYDKNFLEFENDLGFANRDNRPPPSGPNFLGDIIASPANVGCAHTSVGPDGSKYILVDPTFSGPSSETDCIALKKNIAIDLKDTLLETPDEISYRINTILQQSTTGNESNLAPIKTLPESYGDNTADQDFKKVFNFSGNTLINIPANGQIPAEIAVDGKYSKVIYSNMAVKNIKKWEGGMAWLQTTDDNTDLNMWDFIDSGIMRGNDAHIDKLNLYPAILGASFNAEKPFYDFFPEYNGVNTRITYRANTGVAGNLQYYFLELFNDNTDDGDLPFSFIHLVSLRRGNTTTFYLGRIIDAPTSSTLIGLELYETNNEAPPNAQTLKQPLSSFGFIHFPTDANAFNNFKLEIYETGTSNTKNIINFNNDTRDQAGNLIVINPTYLDDIIYNGLPYITCGDSNSGGRLANHMEDETDYTNKSNDYTAIPDGYAIPFNIKNNSANREKIKKYLQMNEFYIGTETEIDKMQADNANWICQLDLGFNDTHLSTMAIYPFIGVNDNETRGFRDSNANFSFFGPYYPNIISHFNNNNHSDDYVINNKFFPYQIYPLNSASHYGSSAFSTRHNIFVYSRYHQSIYDKIKMTNLSLSDGDLILNPLSNANDTSNGQVLEFATRYVSAGHQISILSDLKQTFIDENIIIGETSFNGVFGLGRDVIFLVNANNTAQGGGDAVDYTLRLDNNASYRTCGRICFGLNAGFDPSPLIPGSEFLIPMNKQQGNNSNTDVSQWNVVNFTAPGASVPTYSSYIEDYINNVFVGTTNMQLNWNGDRFEFVNLHTPRLFNASDSKATGINVGQQVAFFNEKGMPFSKLRYLKDDEAPNLLQVEYFNPNIADSLSGIGIIGLFSKNQFENINLETLEGALICGFNEDFTQTQNYEGALFSRLGFKLKQFLFPFGSQDKRINLFFQDNTGDNRDNYCNFFTTEGFLNQSISQLISIYGPNFPDDDQTINLRGLPQYFNGYVGLQTFALNVESFKIRALNLPNRLINSYYQIITNLPTTTYISRNNMLNVSSYCFKQYKTGNFFFSYASDQQATATEDFVLSTIHTEIRNNQGVLAPNLGKNNTVFYKITYPQNLNMPNPGSTLNPTEESLIRLNANIKDMSTILTKKNKNIKIGMNAQKIINEIAAQNKIQQQVFAPPIPNAPLVGLDIIPDQPAVFNLQNADGSTNVDIMEPIGAEQKEPEERPVFGDPLPDIPAGEILTDPATSRQDAEINKKLAEKLIKKYEKKLDVLREDDEDKSYKDFLREQGIRFRGKVPKYTIEDRKMILSDYISQLEEVSMFGGKLPTIEQVEQTLVEDGTIEEFSYYTGPSYESGAAAAMPVEQQLRQKVIDEGGPKRLIGPEDEALNTGAAASAASKE